MVLELARKYKEGIYLSIDFQILDFIQAHMRCDFLDTAMPFVTKLGDVGLIWIALALTLLLIPKARRAGAAVAAGLLLEALCCNVWLKPMVARIRPYDVNTAVQLLIPKPVDFSFPSGHTAAAFASTAALYASKNRLWLPALVLSVLLAFSRMYLYVHYPTDVLGGALLGGLSGWLGNSVIRGILIWKKHGQSKDSFGK